MTGDRRKHPRAPVPGDSRELPVHRRREPAETHFRHMGGPHAPHGAASE